MNNTRETIAQLCKSMKLSARMADNAMTITGRTNQEYLINLFQNEVNCRRKSTATKRMTDARFPYEESFDEFDPHELVFSDEFGIEDCMDLTFLNEKRNILMYGNPGTGKTMLSICIGIQACHSGISIRFFDTESLISELKDAYKKGRLTDFKAKHTSARIIILDEFGYIPYDPDGAQLLFNFVSNVYKKSSIIVTTNKEFSEWREILGDLKLTKAFTGRIIHKCELIVFPGEDRRISNSSILKMYRSMMKDTDTAADLSETM